MTEAAEPLPGVAEILAAGDPGVWRGLAAEHVADHTGHCRACGSAAGASPVWPCNLRAIADAAARITAGD